MYEEYFEEAAEYTTREALERAYALGVESVCGDFDEASYERLKERSPDTYDKSIIELAYEEGRAKALELEAKEEDRETIWERLVETALEADATARTGVPTERPELLSGPEDCGPAAGVPDSLDLPSFLRR